MRRNRDSIEDWVDTKWQPGTIDHTFQDDGYSCGVFVMQVIQIVAYLSFVFFQLFPHQTLFLKLISDGFFCVDGQAGCGKLSKNSGKQIPARIGCGTAGEIWQNTFY